jgi:hypothetical protein
MGKKVGFTPFHLQRTYRKGSGMEKKQEAMQFLFASMVVST